MSKKSVIGLAVIASLFTAASAHADHNSIWGAGYANMPNDIHNSAIEDDQDVFMDLVQYGDGADSENRYDDTTYTADTSVTGSSTRTIDATSRMGSSAMGSRSATTVSRGSSRR